MHMAALLDLRLLLLSLRLIVTFIILLRVLLFECELRYSLLRDDIMFRLFQLLHLFSQHIYNRVPPTLVPILILLSIMKVFSLWRHIFKPIDVKEPLLNRLLYQLKLC